jgi:MerR family transcriptional regulator, copper efflux regulator
MKPIHIGEVARQSGVGVETIRFYEKEGLMPEPPRRDSGYRLYQQDAVLRLRFIQRAKDLGFSLKEIKELLSLRIDPATTCEDVLKRAEMKSRDIEGKIRTLQRMKKVLSNLVAACPGQGPVDDCPILESLEDKDSPRPPISSSPARNARRPTTFKSTRKSTAPRRTRKGGNHVPLLPR